MTTPQEPAPETDSDTETTPGDANGSEESRKPDGSSDSLEDEAPLDADEGDPQLDSYPG